MTDNARKVCYSLLRELNCGRDETDIFYIAYAASLPYARALEAMDEIISLGGAERLDIKKYKIFNIRAVLDAADDVTPFFAPPKKDEREKQFDEVHSRVKHIVTSAEVRMERIAQRRREFEEAAEKYEKARKRVCREEEKTAAQAIADAIEKIKRERKNEALCYPSGRYAERFAEKARGNLVWDKTEGNIYLYVDGLYYSTGEQVRFRLVHYGSYTYLGDDRFLLRKVSAMKGISSSDAERRIRSLLKTSDIGMTLLEIKANASEKTALADYFRLYFFIQTVIDSLV